MTETSSQKSSCAVTPCFKNPSMIVSERWSQTAKYWPRSQFKHLPAVRSNNVDDNILLHHHCQSTYGLYQLFASTSFSDHVFMIHPAASHGSSSRRWRSSPRNATSTSCCQRMAAVRAPPSSQQWAAAWGNWRRSSTEVLCSSTRTTCCSSEIFIFHHTPQIPTLAAVTPTLAHLAPLPHTQRAVLLAYGIKTDI